MSKKIIILILVIIVIILGVAIASTNNTLCYKADNFYIVLADKEYTLLSLDGKMLQTGQFLVKSKIVYLMNNKKPLGIIYKNNKKTYYQTPDTKPVLIKNIPVRSVRFYQFKNGSQKLAKKTKNKIFKKIQKLKNKSAFELYLMYLKGIILNE